MFMSSDKHIGQVSRVDEKEFTNLIVGFELVSSATVLRFFAIPFLLSAPT